MPQWVQKGISRYIWPPDTKARIIELIESGVDTRAAVKAFAPDVHGHCPTRSALIGKANYLGLYWNNGKGRKRVEKPIRHPAPPRPQRGDNRLLGFFAKSLSLPEERASLAALNNTIPLDQRKTLVELTGYTCRWPVGHPGKPDFFFCGADCALDTPYCPDHTAFATRA